MADDRMMMGSSRRVEAMRRLVAAGATRDSAKAVTFGLDYSIGSVIEEQDRRRSRDALCIADMPTRDFSAIEMRLAAGLARARYGVHYGLGVKHLHAAFLDESTVECRPDPCGVLQFIWQHSKQITVPDLVPSMARIADLTNRLPHAHR